MKTWITNILLVSGFLLALSGCKQSPPSDLAAEILIPKPDSILATGRSYELTKESKIVVGGNDEIKKIGSYLADKLNPATGFNLVVETSTDENTSGNIFLSLKEDAQLGDEGYELTVTEDGVTLTANKPAGLFMGVQTIRQLFPDKIEVQSTQQGPWYLATGTVRDYPVYAWRGSMLDVARHFFSVEEVKQYIDMISYYKMNIMHLHLTDDQGWRIEIKSWPNLTLHGGSTEVGGAKGGYYSQEQYADIVAYASSRYITVIPEIDMPSHINAALASYGELNGGTIVPVEGRIALQNTTGGILGAKSKPTELYTGTEVGWSTLRLEKAETFKFVDDVLRELAAITPGPYLHIGGDEAHVTKKEDYIVFINRFQEMVKAHNKKMVGWEEIAQGNIIEGTVAQYWHSSKYAVMAVEKGAKVIMSPATKAYLDMQYDSTSRIGLHWAAYIEVDSAYMWDPATNAEGVAQENILGVEAPLWTETVTNMDDIEYLVFPRLPGYAEIGWTSASKRSWDEYKVRLGKHGSRMKAMGIDYYKSKFVPWVEAVAP